MRRSGSAGRKAKKTVLTSNYVDYRGVLARGRAALAVPLGGGLRRLVLRLLAPLLVRGSGAVTGGAALLAAVAPFAVLTDAFAAALLAVVALTAVLAEALAAALLAPAALTAVFADAAAAALLAHAAPTAMLAEDALSHFFPACVVSGEATLPWRDR